MNDNLAVVLKWSHSRKNHKSDLILNKFYRLLLYSLEISIITEREYDILSVLQYGIEF